MTCEYRLLQYLYNFIFKSCNRKTFYIQREVIGIVLVYQTDLSRPTLGPYEHIAQFNKKKKKKRYGRYWNLSYPSFILRIKNQTNQTKGKKICMITAFALY